MSSNPPPLPKFKVKENKNVQTIDADLSQKFDSIKLKPTVTVVKTRGQMFQEVEEFNKELISNIELPKREFLKVSDSENPKIKIETFNILADIYTSFSMFKHIPKHAVMFEYRREGILKEIKSNACDIICLQELQKNAYEDFFYGELSREYDSQFIQRTTKSPWKDTLESDKLEGVGIFYSKKFNLVKKLNIKFNQIAYQEFQNGKIKEKELNDYTMHSHNVGLCLLLEIKELKSFLIVSTTHANWNYDNQEAQLWQTKKHTEEVEKFRNQALEELKLEKLPVIICGDFNSKPDSLVYKYMTGDDNPLGLKSSYSSYGDNVDAPITVREGYTLDYIFYNSSLLLTKRLEITKDFTRESMPSEKYPSDHLSIAAEFSLN